MKAIQYTAAYAALILGVSVCIGYLFKVELLLSWSDGSMPSIESPATFALFFMTIMAFAAHKKLGNYREFIIVACAAFMMGAIFITYFSAWVMRDVPFSNARDYVGSSDLPALSNGVAIMIMSVSGFMRGFFDRIGAAMFLSRIAALIGATTLIGHVMNIDWLLLYWEHTQFPIALPASVSLILCGIAINGRLAGAASGPESTRISVNG